MLYIFYMLLSILRFFEKALGAGLEWPEVITKQIRTLSLCLEQ